VDELKDKATADGIELAGGDELIDDVLTYALFPQIGLKFLKNRNNPAAFEPIPTGKETTEARSESGDAIYTVTVEGQTYTVTVNDGGDLTGLVRIGSADEAEAVASEGSGNASPVPAPLAFDQMVPAVGQGAIAIQCREDEAAKFGAIFDAATARAVNFERAFQSALGGGCHTAFAAHATADTLYLFHESTGLRSVSITSAECASPVEAAARILKEFGLL
jgi:hypothetical protein